MDGWFRRSFPSLNGASWDGLCFQGRLARWLFISGRLIIFVGHFFSEKIPKGWFQPRPKISRQINNWLLPWEAPRSDAWWMASKQKSARGMKANKGHIEDVKVMWRWGWCTWYSILIISYYARGCRSSLLKYQVCSLSLLHPLGVGATQLGPFGKKTTN